MLAGRNTMRKQYKESLLGVGRSQCLLRVRLRTGDKRFVGAEHGCRQGNHFWRNIKGKQ